MILDHNGKPIAEKDLTVAQTADRARYGSLPSTFDAVKNLTPAKIAQLFKSAEEGDLGGQHDLFMEMEEKDTHLYSELSKRRRAVLAIDWAVVPPADATPAETKATDAATAMLRNLNDFEDLCYDLLNAVGHGFSNIELTWSLVNKEWRVSAFNARPHSWFTLDKDTKSTFLLKAADGEAQPLLPFGWISHVHKSKTGYVARAGLMRVLAWPYMFKHFAVGDWAEFLETYGLPVRVGKYPVGATDAEKNTLFGAVMALGRNAAAVMPETMTVEFMQAASSASKSHDPFSAMADWADKAMSKAILGGTLTSQADGKTSTNALGTVHNEVRQELVKSDAKQLAGTLTRDLIFPWLQLNGHNVEFDRCPRFEFDLIDTADVTVWAESLGKLLDAGMDNIPVAWVHKELGIPEATKGEAVLRRAAAVNPVQKTAQKALLKAGLANNDAPLLQLANIETPQALMQSVNNMIEPLIKAVSMGASTDEMSDIVLAAWPDVDDAQLQALLTQAFFIADMWARAQP